MTPAHERKAKERQAKRDAGLVRVEVWVPKGDAQKVRAIADDLCNPPTISGEARQHTDERNHGKL